MKNKASGIFLSFQSLSNLLNQITEGAFAPLPADKLQLQVPLFSAKEHLPKVGGNKYVLPVQGSSIFKQSI